MALGKAVGVGMVAAIGVPAIMRTSSGAIGDWIRSTVVHLELGGFTINFSWTLFAVVTLVAWGLLAWSER